ncbi:MAG: TPM domain-containing protein [Sandaracinobacteroides sp.]
MILSDLDMGRIAAAIETAEARTDGEIVCTLAAEKHRYAEWVLALAAALGFAVPVLLTAIGFGPTFWMAAFGQWRTEPLSDWQTAQLFVLMQVVVLALATLLLWWSPFAQRLAPQAIRRDRVHEIALKQFLARGTHLTATRTGVLIHVSLEDHIVEVIADEGIYAKVSPETWGEAVAALLAGIRRGDTAQGFVDAIGLAGDVLAAHFPKTDSNPDELPNRLVIV